MLLALACGNAPSKPAPRLAPNETADMVIVGGLVVTRALPTSTAEAIAITRGKVLAVGKSAQIEALVGPNTRRIDVRGAVVLPGLVDAHAHLAGLGDALATIDLRGTGSYAEVLERVAKAARDQPDGWLVGRGWDQNDWADKNYPTGAELERVAPGRNVWLRRVDGHAALASPAALKAARVDRGTADPEGGRVLRDAKGEPTGVLIDNALALVDAVVTPPDPAERRRRVLRALDEVVRYGITGVHDMGVPSDALTVFEALDAEGKLPIRVYSVLSHQDPQLEARLARGPRIGEMLTVRAVKFFADGALGSRGAALLAPYSDDPENSGLLLTPPEVLRTRLEQVLRAGFQPCVHAIGDRANRMLLDAYAELVRERDARPRIEHAQVVAPEDIPRFAKLGVVASMQPTHATSDMPWAPARLGPDRLGGAYAWRTFTESGARLAFGSDFPVERTQILEGLYAALARSDRDGRPAGGWLPSQKLTFGEALAGFTSGAAYASFTEERRGQLEPGFDADVTVIEGGAPLRELARTGTGAPSLLLQARVVMTITNGRVVYGAP
jgi:predicted amidohydrolase YtcJ